MWDLPATVEGDIRRAAVLELDVQRREVGAKGQTWRHLLLARLVGEAEILSASLDGRHLLADDRAARVVLDDGGVVDGEAAGVAVICAKIVARLVGEPVEVELLARVRVVNVDATTLKVVGRVLHRPLLRLPVSFHASPRQDQKYDARTYDVSSAWILGPSHTVAQSPAHDCTVGIVCRRIRRQKIGDVEDADLAARRLDLHGWGVDVAVGTSCNQEQIWVRLVRDQECPRRVRGIGIHARQDGTAARDRSGYGIVFIRNDLSTAGEEEGTAVRSESDAVVKLNIPLAEGSLSRDRERC